ncbi:hypothetical protein PG993_006254 [Apiospora rasikravindrae]|uniref:CorA-like transporter domain-containing protein n=1 Tax=Apiospora rasikravindrae TaxID=990691 RepID=A0ABR1T571_9PEZI
MYDGLVQAWAEPQAWPSNLLDKRIPKSKLKQTQLFLQSQRRRLFVHESRPASVYIDEIYTGEHHMVRNEVKDRSTLEEHYVQHINIKEKDPRLRHIFLTAANSYAPLDCTLEMFQLLCTYHQVSPGFLDLISSFGRHNGGWNVFYHMHVLHQLSSSTTPLSMAIPEIGRSGKEFRVAYKLFAMEQQEDEFDNKWVMRQTATYHTLDLVEWKALWITVKANDLIRERVDDINSESCTYPGHSPAAEALSRSLATHQVIFDWCTDGWGLHISRIADAVEEILRPLTATPIPPEQGIKNTTERLEVLNKFSLRDVRQLDSHCNALREARTAILANLSIAGEVSEIYQDLLKSAVFSPNANDKDCVEAIRQFQISLRSIAHNLRSDCSRIDNILERMSDGKNLVISKQYSRILDSKRTDMEKLFTLDQHDSSKRMEMSSNAMEEITKRMHTIAERTERDTSSMHFITFLTLVFLPGTFLGVRLFSALSSSYSHDATIDPSRALTLNQSIFSTPIFGDADEGSGKTWALNSDLLFLFLKICLPMMTVIVGFWILYRKYMRRMELFVTRTLMNRLLAKNRKANDDIV